MSLRSSRYGDTEGGVSRLDSDVASVHAFIAVLILKSGDELVVTLQPAFPRVDHKLMLTSWPPSRLAVSSIALV